MYEWYSMAWTDVVKKLNSNVNNGLSLEQIERLQSLRKDEEILKFKEINTYSLLITQAKEFWVITSIICIIAFVFFKQWFLILILIVISCINHLLIISKQLKKAKEIDELKKLDSHYAKVLRQGKFLKVHCNELVAGDIVHLERGDIVPADLRVIDSEGMRVNESLVTGEEYITDKYSAKIMERDIPLSEMKNILFKASIITAGRGEGIVIAAGANAQIGRIIKILADEKNKHINFIIKDINYILNKMSSISLIISAVAGGIFYFLNKNIISSLNAFFIILMSFIPICLVCTINAAAKTILTTFDKKNIKIKDLTVIKAFGEANLIFVDKIGTISEECMKVKKIFSDDKFYDLQEETLELTDNLERIADIGMLCNNFNYNTKSIYSNWVLIEKSLLDFGVNNFSGKEDIEDKQKRVLNVPFDSELKIMATINKVENNYRANIKGAVDSLIGKCKYIMKNGIEKEINEWDIATAKKAYIKMNSLGLATLAFAYRNFNYEPSLGENIESNLVFVGLIGFSNDIFNSTYDAIDYVKRERLRYVIAADDNKLAVMAVGKELGILAENKLILSGEEIDKLSDNELKEIIDKVNILSAITYDQKNKVINMLAQIGHKIVVTGSKLNELPALKSAQVGLSVGKSCSSIVKKLCDGWIEDYSFKNILSIKEYSYKILSSINKAVYYKFICTYAQGLFIIFLMLFGKSNSAYFTEVILINTLISFLGGYMVAMGYEQESIQEMSYLGQNNEIKKNKYGKEILAGIIIAATAFICLIVSSKAGFIYSKAFALLILVLEEITLIGFYRKFKWAKCRNIFLKIRNNK